jgi:hypothetical protein
MRNGFRLPLDAPRKDAASHAVLFASMSPSTVVHTTGLMEMISAAVTPVVLVSCVAVFFSALAAKHSHLSDQVRALTSEFRKTSPDDVRKFNIGRQLVVFERRMTALWASTYMLGFALLFFCSTILFILGSQRKASMGGLGLGSLILGLLCLLLGILLELIEITYARQSLHLEMHDIDVAMRDKRANAKSA